MEADGCVGRLMTTAEAVAYERARPLKRPLRRAALNWAMREGAARSVEGTQPSRKDSRVVARGRFAWGLPGHGTANAVVARRLLTDCHSVQAAMPMSRSNSYLNETVRASRNERVAAIIAAAFIV